MIHNFMSAGGWILVSAETGFHWVYGPLWDPAKLTETKKAILIADVIKRHLKSVVNPEAKEMLISILKEQAQIVTEKFAASIVDDADDQLANPELDFHVQVPPYAPHIGGPVGPDGPDYRKAMGKELTAQIDAKIGITLLGTLLNFEPVKKAALLI